jgi:hypothetical protein
MLMQKTKLAQFAMGLIVTSIITVGAISPVSAMESQPNLDNNAGIKAQCEVMKDSYTNEHAAAQFKYNADGERVLTVTPKSDFRSHNENCRNEAGEAPVVVVETPVIDEETPVVETPVVDEETPVVETPIIDEDPTDESIQNGFYSHLLDAYDKLLTLYEKLLNSFSPATAI